MQIHLSVDSPPLVINCFSLPWYKEKHLHKENLCPPFRQIKGGQRTFSAPDFQLLSAQNNPYAKVTYFGVAYHDLLHVERSRKS